MKPTGTLLHSGIEESAQAAAERERAIGRKSRRIRLVILGCLVLIPLLTFLETRVFQLGTVAFPVSGNVLVFALININVLLLLLMVFLVLRNLVQLVFERRRKFLGTKLRTKLVISFVSLSLIPTGLLFFIALQFVSTSMDYWFNINVEQSLIQSLDVAKEVYQDGRSQVDRLGKALAVQVSGKRPRELPAPELASYLEELRQEYQLAGLELISEQRTLLAGALAPDLLREQVPELPAELLRRGLEGESKLSAIQEGPGGELVRGLTPLALQAGSGKYLVLVTSQLIPRARLEQMSVISQGLEGYRQLMILKQPIKTSLLLMLLIVTLLIVFCAIWFGFYVARGLTGPIRKLGEATRRVADGDFDFELSKESGDEMGMLVDSFNRMTRDLLLSKRQLEETNQALYESNLEIDKRRRYTEIILQNVAAGVISMDETGRVTTFNRFAEDLLQIPREQILFRLYQEVLAPHHLTILEGFVRELAQSSKTSIQRPLRLSVRDETFSLRVNFTRLEDEEGHPLGMVLVFDNLTELEKAQRLAAWREVARRIAHEVKNPLTPIQLSAQRLRKRYLVQIGEDSEVFDLCTRTIINQVDELKRLVSEFSSFARMPAVSKSKNSLSAMVREILTLYQEAHKDISFPLVEKEKIPEFLFDFKQMRRVLINLLDNAVAVVGPDGCIETVLFRDQEQNSVFLEVRDNGPGVADEDKLRLFEPYFSTKKTGTGLGLAIATTVVADHGGYIRVRDNEPAGARFIVELPFNLG